MPLQNHLSHLVPGDDVAILPNLQAEPSEILGIGAVFYVGAVYIQLADGRMYATIGGTALRAGSNDCIVPLTDTHRAAHEDKNR